jgi:4-amino-4-deoxy-L-arabinose transferase-like glycosyltransferase
MESSSLPARQGAGRWLAPLAIILAIVSLRLVALGSDAYARLDWSAGLLTDEGFYVHNARNAALFGHARTDEFNNMLLSPLLHYLQVAVFSMFGVGAIQARSISVACSLLTLGFIYAAMRRAFDNRIAWTSVAFLGLDHVNLLFNRMALMDTPAAMLAAAAFYAFVRSSGEKTESRKTGQVWHGAAGILLGLTVVSRMLCGYLLPVPFVALFPIKSSRQVRAALRIAAGIAAVVALYATLWYLPNRAEIAPMNAYYRTRQIQPRSLVHLLENIRHAVVGDFRGVSPYLFRHTPVLFGLTLLWVTGRALRRGREKGPNATERYLIAWLFFGVAMLAVISYSPSRYYVTVYPALALLAAIAVWRLDSLWETLSSGEGAARIARAVLAAFLAFHATLALVHYGGVIPPAPTAILLYGIPVAVGVAAGMMPQPRVSWGSGIGWALVGLWAAWNAAWLVDWARHINYSQQDTSRWLAANLPSNSVLIGDVAPGLSLDNPFRAIHVQPGLVNDKDPVGRYAGSPRYVVILDGRWKERYWLDRYPELVDPARRIKLAHVLRWDVGIYAVDDAARP